MKVLSEVSSTLPTYPWIWALGSCLGFGRRFRQDAISGLTIFIEPSFSFTLDKLLRDGDGDARNPGQQAHLCYTFNDLTCEHCFGEGTAATHGSMVGKENTIALPQGPGDFLSELAVLARRYVFRAADFVADHLRLFFDDYRVCFRCRQERAVANSEWVWTTAPTSGRTM